MSADRQQIPTVAQRLDHIRTLVDAMTSVSANHAKVGPSPVLWAEVNDALTHAQHDLESLAKAMDASVFCRACRDSCAPAVETPSTGGEQ